jgi:hypothetical protein
MKQIVRYVLPMFLVCSTTHAQRNFWQQTSGFIGSSVSDLVTNASGHVFATNDSGVFRTTNNGASWVRVRSAYSYSPAIDSDGRVFVAGLDSNKTYVFRSTDSGGSWSRLGNGWCVSLGPWCFPLAVRIAANSQEHVFVALHHYLFNDYYDDGIWHSTDHGLSWDSLVSFGYPTRYTSLEIDRDDRIFAGIVSNYYDQLPRAFRSSDNGTTWSRADSGLPQPVSAFAFSSFNGTFVGIQDTVNAIYRSTNNGNSWSFNDIVGGDISAMLFDRTDNLFVATYGSGVYRNGVQVNSGLTDLNVSSLALSPTGYLYAGTATGTVFRSVSPMVSVNEIAGGKPSMFLLEQNYPNPFNPSTNLSFSIPYSSLVILKVYDMLGREVRTLVNENLHSGNYETTFDATGMASGVYFYRLSLSTNRDGQAGEFTQTRRLLLVR